jgi:hypothetical protein
MTKEEKYAMTRKEKGCDDRRRKGFGMMENVDMHMTKGVWLLTVILTDINVIILLNIG